MRRDRMSGSKEYSRKEVSVVQLVFVALMFVLISGANLYMQESKPIAGGPAIAASNPADAIASDEGDFSAISR